MYPVPKNYISDTAEQYNTNDNMMCPNPSTDRQSNGGEMLQLELRKRKNQEKQVPLSLSH